jgi:protein SCO1
MNRRAVFACGGGTIAATLAGGVLATSPAKSNTSHPVIPDTEVIDQDGERFLFYSDLIKDRVVLINFFYQSCGYFCPLATQNLRQVQDLLADRMGQDIFMYSITLQPVFDRPHILKDYADTWEIRPGWKFLTGEAADIEHLRKSLGFASLDPDYDLILDNHTGILRYGNGRLDRWAATPALARPAWIAKAVNSIAGRSGKPGPNPTLS